MREDVRCSKVAERETKGERPVLVDVCLCGPHSGDFSDWYGSPDQSKVDINWRLATLRRHLQQNLDSIGQARQIIH